jgi:hypothetical protein
MTTKDKLLLAAVAALGLALGYTANGKLAGDMTAMRTIAMTCKVVAAAEQARQLTSAQGEAIFGAVMKVIDKDRPAPRQADRARLCAPAP